jgi:hypothetical protein
VSATADRYGMIAEFTNVTALVRAIESTRRAGYRHMDAYTPFPVEEVSEALGHHRSVLPLLVLIGGILGALGGYSLAYWTSVVDYPLNVGGRPLNSVIAFIPIVFECTILIAALFTVFGMLALNGLPMPHHPIFNAQDFALASRDRFFLCVEATDPLFDLEKTRSFLEGLEPHAVSEVDA